MLAILLFRSRERSHDRPYLFMLNAVEKFGAVPGEPCEYEVIAERTCMYQMLAMNTGRKLRALPEASRRRWRGAWGDTADARLHLNAWRRVLDREEPDYAT